jgi:[acyl-carrier-protein] S-malonyltransferase
MLSDNPKITYTFPGQGSQSVGMGRRLAEEYPQAYDTFKEADDLLGVNLSRLAWEGPVDELNDTVNTQPALFVHSVAVLRVIENVFPSLKPAYVAGHSMGELSALVAAKCLGFKDCLELVRTRGVLMKQAGERNPGGMAAILGMEISEVDRICSLSSATDEPVQIANDNCPGQVVISGASRAIQRAMDLANQAGAKRVIPLAVSIAAHSPLMEEAQDLFSQAVEHAPLTEPHIPMIGNVSARPLNTVAEIRSDLQAQLNSRVRWTESVQFIIASGVSIFLEIGNGNVLSGLLRRISKDAIGIPVGNPEDILKIPVV